MRLLRNIRNIIGLLLLIVSAAPIEAQNGPDIEKIDNAVVVVLCYDHAHNYIGHGSGFFIDADGILVTNYHVLENVYSAQIKTEDGSLYQLDKIITGDKAIDLVTFTIKKNYTDQKFPFVTIAKEIPKKGSDAWAIGTPFDPAFMNTASKGLVSNIHQGETRTQIQTNAEITHGSSGGGLFNSKGEVIGVTSSIIEDKEGNGARANLNFAIWIGELKKLSPINLSRIYDDALIPVKVSFYITYLSYSKDVSLYIDGRYMGTFSYEFAKGTPSCGQEGTITTYLSKGYHKFYAYEKSTGTSWNGDFTINTNDCFLQGLANKPSAPKPDIQVYIPQTYVPQTTRNADMGSKSTYNWMISPGLSFVNTGRGVPLSLYLERYNLWHKYSVRTNFQYLKAYQDFSKNNVYALDYYSVGVDFKRIFTHELRFWDWYIAASFNLRSSTKNYSRPEFVSNGVYTTTYLVSVNKSVGFVPAFRLGGELRLSPRFSLSTDVGLGYNTSTNLPVADMNFLLGYRLNFKKK